MIKPITEILEGTNFGLHQARGSRGGSPSSPTPLVGSPAGKNWGAWECTQVQAGERSQMVIDRGVSQTVRLHLLLPSDNIAFETGRNAVVP